MPVTINGTTGVVFPDGVTQGSGVPTASGTSGAPLVSNGTIYTQNTAVGVAFGGTGATDAGTARSNLGTNDAANITTGTLSSSRLPSSGVNAASITTGTLAVANGGTGSTSLTANRVLLGNGTSSLQEVAPGANGNILTSNGTTWVSQAPAGGGVTSAVAGNGIAVSGATGAVTFSAACPSFGSVGSYCWVYTRNIVTVNGSNYSGGSGDGNLAPGRANRTFAACVEVIGIDYDGSLSGTWKWMSANSGSSAPHLGIACRVS